MNIMRRYFCFSLVVVLLFSVAALGQGERTQLKALIVDGQNNHDWRSTTPVLRDILEATGLFTVEVATSPGARASMEGFAPKFSDFDVVVLNYNGADWPQETQAAFEAYVKNGGGVVVYHAADNSFPNWRAFNEMIGIGGWGGRNEKSGPYVRFRDGKMVLDTRPGRGGSHGPQHEFQVVMRDREHPITKGLPEKWLHVKDELYSELRGPAQNLTLLATAYADPARGGTGEHEPALFTIAWGKGRIFHTTLGHDGFSSKCVGFICTLQRGTEWAATGKVTLTDVPGDFPTADKVSMRQQIKGGIDIANYDFGDSRKDLVAIEEEVRGASAERLKEIEAGLLQVLETPGATYASKQFVCRLLRRMGAEQSVGVLGRLLRDVEMSHMARFVLEGMENEAAGQTLREALGELEGDLRIGVIGSVGARGDKEAVWILTRWVGSEDVALAEAAIKALGQIGGMEAAKALGNFQNENLRALQADVLLALYYKLPEAENPYYSNHLYQYMLENEFPTMIKIVAYRGLIRSDKERAAETVVEMLKSEDEAYHRAAGRFVVDVAGEEGTRVLAEGLESLSSGAQVILLNALGERGDKAALEDVAKLVSSEDEAVCMAALAAVGDLGGAESVGLLAEMATVGGVKGEAAYSSLCRLRDAEVDDMIMSNVRDAEPAVRLVLIRSMAGRGNTEAALMLLRMARFANVEVRRESVRALGVLGGEDDVVALVGLLAGADDDGLLEDVEGAIMSVSNRLEGKGEVSRVLLAVLPRLNTAERVSVMRMLGRLGGGEALAALKAVVWNEDYPAEVRDEAIRSLATWEDAAPAGVLLELAQKSAVETHKVLALRGYIRMAGLRSAGTLEQRQKMYEAAMAAAERAEEKRLVLGAVAALENRWALEFVAPYLKDEGVKAEAEAAYQRILEALTNIVGRARQAAIHGSGPAYEAGRNRDCIGFWGNSEAWVSWEVEVAQAGVYAVVVSQSAVREEAGSEYLVKVGEQQVRGVVQSTGDWGRFMEVELGEVEIGRPGSYVLELRPIKKANNYVMNLRSVTLRRK